MHTVLSHDNETDWLKSRQITIGASEASASIGVNPYKSAAALQYEKQGDVEPEDISEKEIIYWGNVLEAPIRQRVGELLLQDVVFDGPYELLVSGDHPFMSATLDGKLTSNHALRDRFEGAGLEPPEPGSTGTLQIKTTSAWNSSNFQDDWPLAYQVQCQHEMIVAELDWGVMAVLVGGQELRLFPFLRHDQFCKGLVNQLAVFWERVRNREQPPIDGSASTAEVIKKLYPEDDGEIVTLPHEAVLWDGERTQLKEEINESKKRVDELDNLIKASIGPASIGQVPGGDFEYSYKHQKRKGYTVEPTEFRQLRRRKAK